MTTKICSGKCGQEKDISKFYIRSDNGRPYGKCIICHNEESNEWYENNKLYKIEQSKKYADINGAELRVYQKKYRNDHKEENKKYQKQYRIDNEEELKLKNKEYINTKRKTNINFRIKTVVSSAVRRALKLYGSSKNGKSILKFLSYTIEELKQHIESLFEPWMTWENWGIYDPKTWNDDDSSTWTWQIDHIQPHSEFHYTTMDCEEFRKCWALSNLRPLNAKQNFYDGFFKTRHKIDRE